MMIIRLSIITIIDNLIMMKMMIMIIHPDYNHYNLNLPNSESPFIHLSPPSPYPTASIKVFLLAKERKVPLTVSLYSKLLEACAHHRRVDLAEPYFKEITKRLALPPTLSLYSPMIRLYAESGKIMKAIGMMETLEKYVSYCYCRVLVSFLAI